MFVLCHISVINVFIVHSFVQLLSNLECPPFPSNPVQNTVPFRQTQACLTCSVAMSKSTGNLAPARPLTSLSTDFSLLLLFFFGSHSGSLLVSNQSKHVFSLVYDELCCQKVRESTGFSPVPCPENHQNQLPPCGGYSICSDHSCRAHSSLLHHIVLQHADAFQKEAPGTTTLSSHEAQQPLAHAICVFNPTTNHRKGGLLKRRWWKKYVLSSLTRNNDSRFQQGSNRVGTVGHRVPTPDSHLHSVVHSGTHIRPQQCDQHA